jgi:hypothetical protein
MGTRGSDLALTILVAALAGAALGAIGGLAQNWFGWRTGYLVPVLSAIAGAAAAMAYRARQRPRSTPQV